MVNRGQIIEVLLCSHSITTDQETHQHIFRHGFKHNTIVFVLVDLQQETTVLVLLKLMVNTLNNIFLLDSLESITVTLPKG